MKNDNRGMSLVEIIIVVSIVAILGGALIGSTGVIGRYRAKECAKKTISAINNTKVHAMSKSLGGTLSSTGTTSNASNVYAHFYTKDGDFVCDIYANPSIGSVSDPIESKVLVKNKVQFEYQYLSSATWNDLKTTEFYLGFNRSNGGVLPQSGGEKINKIRIRGGSADYLITIYPDTGKSEMVMQ